MRQKLTIVLIFFQTVLFGKGVHLNQVGYMPHLSKTVFVSSKADSFFLHDASTKEILFRDKLTLWKTSDPSTGLTIYKGDFTKFQTSGLYFITTSTNDTSVSFSISDSVYKDSYYKMLKGFYFQRCGMKLLPAFAGLYFHAACHTSDGYLYQDPSKLIPSTGGWHDAGDYGKYVVNAGVSVGTLLMAYEMFPERFSQDDLNIPESGNKVPDILDEVRYELSWLLTMQDSVSGGVYAKETAKDFEGFIMPQNDLAKRFIYQIASTATADFAAMMARASRVYQAFDPQFSAQCLSASERAWTYLESHPDIVPSGGFKNPSDTKTGEYGDGTDKDERLWAASELFQTTQSRKYHDYYKLHFSDFGIINGAMSWPNLRSMAHLTYLFGNNQDKSVYDQVLFAVKTYAEALLNLRKNDGMQLVLSPTDYYWGSNSEVLNRAVMLIAAYTKTNNRPYFDAALDQFNYILGTNAHNMSFVTGTGVKSVMFPHHRPSVSDGVFKPVPGLLAGGPNKNITQDPVLQSRFTSSTPPALCYIDNEGSYASNEIAINWNAPLVFVAGYFNGEKKVSSVEKSGSLIPGNIYLEQNFPNPFNGRTTISYTVNFPQNIMLKVFDVLGSLVSSRNLGLQMPGMHAYNWEASDENGNSLTSGIYFYLLKGEQTSITKKLVLLK